MTKKILFRALLGLAPLAPTVAWAQTAPVPVVAPDSTAGPRVPSPEEPVAPTGETASVPATGAIPAPAVVAVPVAGPAKADEPKKKHWYEKLAFRGYTQLRYNREFDVQGAKVQILGDSAVAANQTFSIRRARLILFATRTITLPGYICNRILQRRCPALPMRHFLRRFVIGTPTFTLIAKKNFACAWVNPKYRLALKICSRHKIGYRSIAAMRSTAQ